jgi:hypothetical protein
MELFRRRRGGATADGLSFAEYHTDGMRLHRTALDLLDFHERRTAVAGRGGWIVRLVGRGSPMTYPGVTDPLFFQSGDRMSVQEFLETWERMPDVRFAELIDGVVYMPSPVSYEHGRLDTQMQVVLATYAGRSGVCHAVSNATWLMLNSAPQPDIALTLLPEFGGQTRIDRSGLAVGVPELIVEAGRTSASYDLGPKRALYERAGVPEYVTVAVETKEIQWRTLRAGHYVHMQPDAQGVFRSGVFPGLWVSETAFRAGDIPGLLAVLEEGLQSLEFRNYIQSLRG